MASLCHTTNKLTKKEYFFVDGKRVTRSKYEASKFWMLLSNIHTVVGPKFLRNYVSI